MVQHVIEHFTYAGLLPIPEEGPVLAAGVLAHEQVIRWWIALPVCVTARHVVGLRAAAFLTAGIAKIPFWRFLVVDAAAALVGVPVSFGVAFLFADQLERVLADVHRIEALAGPLCPAGPGRLAHLSSLATVPPRLTSRRSRRRRVL